MITNKLTAAAVWTALVAGFLSLVGIGVLIASLLCTIPVYIIWNHALVDAVPGIHPIGWWTAFGVAWFMRLFGHAGSTTCKCECTKNSNSKGDLTEYCCK